MTLVNEFNSCFVEEEKNIINSLVDDFPDTKEDMIADLNYFSQLGMDEMKSFYDSLASKIQGFSDEKFSDLKRYVPLNVTVSDDDILEEDDF